MTISEAKLLVHDIVDTNPSTFSDVRMVRGFNKAQNKVVNIILQNDTLEQWDDPEYTDFNEGFIDIVNGQSEYNVREDDNFVDLIAISKIYIKENPNATEKEYVELLKGKKRMTLDDGIPREYRISGKHIVFDVYPNYDAVDGIKVLFKRKPKEITISDTTRSFGVPPTYNHLVVLLTAYDYARAKVLSNRNDILNEIKEEEKSLGLHVSRQDNNSRQILTARTIDSI